MLLEDRDDHDPLQALIADILEAESRGEIVDRENLLRQHTDHAETLRDFFANRERVKAAADPDTPTLPPRGTGLDDSTLLPSQSPHDQATLPAHPVGDIPATPLTEGPSQTVGRAGGEQVRYFSDYEILEEIARGGMGVVFKARQISLNRTVALKMILSGQFACEEDVQRFHTEAEAAASLNHPGIVPIFEIGEHAGQHYFSMAYIEGESLAQKVSRGPLAPYEAAELVKSVCDAMDYAHQRGVIHRDLKPANVLVDVNGQPKVTDFGLAKKTETDSNLTGTGQILGTPAFMPPEQASGRIDQVGPLADVYSLGAILYCLLTGRPPFQAASPIDTLLQVLEQQPILPRRLVENIPVDLESICMRCLEKDRTLRYLSVKELGNDFQRFLNGEPVEADESSTLKRAWSAMLRETRHVEVMANWGKVWLWHSGQVFILFLLTNFLIWSRTRTAWTYVGLWGIGFASLLVPVWYYRFRSRVQLTPIERQLGQVWGMFFLAVIATGLINHLMGFEPLHLLPLAVLECGMAFGCMAAILGGSFYPMAALCFGLSIMLTLFPQIGPVAFGTAFAIGLFIPGWKFSVGAGS